MSKRAKKAKQLTADDWEKKYTPIPNHIDPNASWMQINDRGTMFETFGEELEFVKKQDPKKVWTLVEGENNEQYICAGFHFVNRIGYVITNEPWTDEMETYLDD